MAGCKSICVVLALAALLAHALAVPTLELDKWNRAYLYEARSVPASLLQGSALYDGGSSAAIAEPMFPLLGYDVKRQCSGPSAVVDPTQVKPGSCQYKPNKDGTFTYWEKQPGDWLRMSNCYCYALDVFKSAWCQPGAASGVEITANSMSCATLRKALLADGAKEVTAATALSGQPAAGHYIAMMFRPQSSCTFARCQPDFHFARKDASGLWSHKAGDAPATNKDANGALIKDPKAATLQGSYTDFCGYFQVTPSIMKVGTIPVPNLVSKGVAKWKSSGLAVTVQPLKYTAGVDDVDAVADYAAQQQRSFAVQRGEAPAGGNRKLLRL